MASHNPYDSLPDQNFWKRSVASLDPDDVDPVGEPPFRVGPRDRVATAGSCFAQHISRALVDSGFSYLVAERGPVERNYGVFSARFGNLHTVRQLLQLFDRAYALFEPVSDVWRRADGRYVDPFRPQVEPGGFADVAALRADRTKHMAAVRSMFETCDIFVFTLGLTEGWRSATDGGVYPLAPGVAGSPPDNAAAEFVNFSVSDMEADLASFIEKLRTVNAGARVILTVSPVPLIATYENRHVLSATVYSKSALRVVAELVSRAMPMVAYFPSYEIITGHHNRYRYFESNLRSVSQEGVENVMRLFFRHYGGDSAPARRTPAEPADNEYADRDADQTLEQLSAIVCDEELIDR